VLREVLRLLMITLSVKRHGSVYFTAQARHPSASLLFVSYTGLLIDIPDHERLKHFSKH